MDDGSFPTYMEPVSSINASESVLILVRDDADAHEIVPLPSVFNIWFAEPSAVGRVMATSPNPIASA